jgi:hypothetical protein
LIDSAVNQLGAFSLGDGTTLLLTHRNTLAPVSQLPEEIVADIMQLATSCVAFWVEDDWIFTALRDWLPIVSDLVRVIALSHVCRSWRQIALAATTLWAQAYPSNGDGALYLLAVERSGAAALRFALSGSSHLVSPFTRLEHMWNDRAGELTKRMQHLWLPWLLPMDGFPAPELESLYRIATHHGSGPYSLPYDAPRLRTLVLHEANLEGEQMRALVHSPILPQLRRLAVSFEHGSWNTFRDVTNLLDVIQRASSVEHLAVRTWYRPDEWMQWIRERASLHDQVVLPQLSRLTLLGDQIIVTALLHHLWLPKDVDLCLDPTIDDEDPDWPELDAQRDFVKDFLLLPAHVPTKIVLSSKQKPPGFTFFTRMELFRADGSRALHLPICGHDTSGIYMPWLSNLGGAVPWDAVREVHIHMLGPPDSLLRMTLRAPRLTVLKLGPSALSCMQRMLVKGERCSPFLPTLRTLVASGTFVTDHLHTLLQAREDASPDHPLETLVIQPMQAGPVDLEHLIERWKHRIARILLTSREQRMSA